MMPLDRLVITAVITSILLAAMVYAVFAQSGWVDHLRNQNGRVCCYNNDGRRLDDPEWKISGNEYTVLFTEGWVPVSQTSVVTMRNKDGIARVWSTFVNGQRTIHCFLPGALG